MADSLVQHGIVRAIADDNGDKVDGFVKVEVTGGTAVWDVNSQSPSDPAVLTLTAPGGGGLATLAVADIFDPSTELNVRTGDAPGDLLLVYQEDALGSRDLATLYRVDADALTEDLPNIVDSGDSQSYVAVAGTICNEVYNRRMQGTFGNTSLSEVLALSSPFSGQQRSALSSSNITFIDMSDQYLFLDASLPRTADRQQFFLDMDGALALVNHRAVPADTDDVVLPGERTLSVSRTGFGANDLDLFDPADLPGAHVTVIAASFVSGVYRINDHTSTPTGVVLANTGDVATFVNDSTTWYLASKNF